MNAFTRLAALTLVAVAAAGCGRTDTKVNSDPGPGRPSRAEGGEKAVRPSEATAPAKGNPGAVGTDSTGRPADSSGGTTGGTAGSGQSGTTTVQPKQDGR